MEMAGSVGLPIVINRERRKRLSEEVRLTGVNQSFPYRAPNALDDQELGSILFRTKKFAREMIFEQHHGL